MRCLIPDTYTMYNVLQSCNMTAPNLNLQWKKKLSRLNMLKNPCEITHILTGIFIVMFALELL